MQTTYIKCPKCGLMYTQTDADLIEQYESIEEKGYCLSCADLRGEL